MLSLQVVKDFRSVIPVFGRNPNTVSESHLPSPFPAGNINQGSETLDQLVLCKHHNPVLEKFTPHPNGCPKFP